LCQRTRGKRESVTVKPRYQGLGNFDPCRKNKRWGDGVKKIRKRTRSLLPGGRAKGREE